MPIYEYYCAPCATSFELRRPVSGALEPAGCPQGHPAARRLVSAFATVRTSAGGAVEFLNAGGGCCGGGACACGR
jgi:putative FmdB family regulatory protein